MKILKAALSLTFCVFAAAPAQAQMTWTDRGFVNASIGVQGGSRDLATSSTFTIYDENATLETTQNVGGGAFFDVGGGYKVWRNLAIGIGFTRISSDADVAVTARVPDPLIHDRIRTVSSTSAGAKHSEVAVNLSGTWMVPVTDKVDVGLSFGPTIFLVSQDVPTSVSVTEPGPSISAATLATADKTTVGIHLGVDVTYLITPRVGAGVLARYSAGSADLEGASDSLGVGGFQIGGGVRIRF